METNDLLREIADEFHNLNLNLVELIKVLKYKNTNSNNRIDDELDETLETLAEAMRAHNSQLEAKKNEATPARIKTENEYQKKQANFDQALKKLGIM
jgi:hypothetical protein